jgi:hypothetical protein
MGQGSVTRILEAWRDAERRRETAAEDSGQRAAAEFDAEQCREEYHRALEGARADARVLGGLGSAAAFGRGLRERG